MGNANSNTSSSINIGELPSVPHVLLKLIDTCHDVDASFGELADIIRQDQALCAKIISVANTPAYAQWNGIKDFDRLIVILGLEPIKAISITAVVQQFFSQFDQNMGQCMSVLWRESLTCAHAAKRLAELTGYPSTDEAYLTGLLHNLGKLGILKLKTELYSEHILNQTGEPELLQIENDLVGIDNASVGSQMLGEFTQNSFVGDAIFFQNADAEQLIHSNHLIKLINVAKTVTQSGFHADRTAESAHQLLGINQPLLDDIASSVQDSVKETAKTYGIELDPQHPTHLDDEHIRIEMAKRVRGFALLHGATSTADAIKSNTDPWEDISRNLKILFRLDRLIIFLPTKEDTLLTSSATYNASSLPEPLSTPIASEQSTITLAAQKGRTLFDLEQETSIQASVLDHQIRRILNADALAAIPLMLDNQLLAVIAAGFDYSQQDFLQQSSNLITQYSYAAAKTVHPSSSVGKSTEQIIPQPSPVVAAETRELAHEANNPIGVIKNYLHVLSIKLEDDTEVTQHIETLKGEIDRVADIIGRMRDVGSNYSEQKSQATKSSPNKIIQRLVALYENSTFITHQIKCQLDLDSAVDELAVDQSSLQQILTNLMKNAAEAMPSGGNITISTRLKNSTKNSSHIEIRVADSGPGVPEDIIQSNFSPVESTKDASHSGLGLSIVKNLLSEMNGQISVQNIREGGAEFVMLLPFNV